ncbi:MAG TPA: TIGR01777 family oxidoreductase, partial [Pyrinomonadaceae bacterium]|nr:TIGR01777 family oxidoreductase [Pyrinomonadaceae bacterium]
EELTEDSAPGDDFLADVCLAWEGATQAAEAAGIRVAHLRFGVVLSAEGGALAKLVTPFKLGVGGKIGSGEQYMSWITLDDAVRAVEFLLARDDLRGPVNVVAPEPVTNRELTATLGEILARPTFFTVPAFGARLAFGEMADGVLLSSARVLPKRLQAANFAFAQPRLEGALRHLLGQR